MNRPPVWPPTQEPSPHLRQHLRLIFRTVSVTFLGVAVGTALNIQTPLLRTAYETVYGHMLHVPILSGILHLPTPLFQMVFIGLFVLQLYLAYRWRRSRIDTGDPPAAAAAAAAAASAASGPGPDPASSFRAHLSSFFTEAWSTQPPPTSAPSGPADCGATSQRPTASTTAQPWSLSSLVTTPAGWMNLRLGTIGLMSAMLGPRILSMITPLTHQPSMLFGTFVFLLQSALFGMVAATEGNLLALPPWVSRRACGTPTMHPSTRDVAGKATNRYCPPWPVADPCACAMAGVETQSSNRAPRWRCSPCLGPSLRGISSPRTTCPSCYHWRCLR
ncbi:hypothetical protein, variant 1 [Fonticula alba]|uniref:Uncharacterized protein n=1 Tax=Fonticula alba TaxID=691883 RepID=A0A058ZHB7_FONAL|nr:hypothetical protein, variant 1 [Fonticula alba]KCV73333.1 hypothetical protein, variant 1 [Fonticula alba]|eukprot:XP_009493035.1 hypothetical protein, variant 1 [Fonticula alba]